MCSCLQMYRWCVADTCTIRPVDFVEVFVCKAKSWLLYTLSGEEEQSSHWCFSFNFPLLL